jgi:hypothetical protein
LRTIGFLLATHQNQSGSHHHGNQANEQNLLDFLHKNILCGLSRRLEAIFNPFRRNGLKPR